MKVLLQMQILPRNVIKILPRHYETLFRKEPPPGSLFARRYIIYGLSSRLEAIPGRRARSLVSD